MQTIYKRDICKKFNVTPNAVKYCCKRIGIKNNRVFNLSDAETIASSFKSSVYFRGDKHIGIIERYLQKWSPSLIGEETGTSKYTVMKAIQEYHDNGDFVIVESKLNFLL